MNIIKCLFTFSVTLLCVTNVRGGCTPGEYDGPGFTDTCKACETGQFQPSDCTGFTTCTTHACGNCGTGQYQNSKGQPSCKTCGTGQYQNSNGQSSCKTCGTGKTTASGGSTKIADCVDCASGKKGVGTSCTDCNFPLYQDQPGQTDCKTCTDCGTVGDQYGVCSGSIGPGTCKSCTRCEAGQYISGCTANSGPGVCQDCALGTFSDQAQQTACQPLTQFATYQPNKYAKSCTKTTNTGNECVFENCPAGKYSEQGASGTNGILDVNCLDCSKGQYKRITTTTACEVCPTGYYQEQKGQSSCTTCPTCPTGHYLICGGMATSCTACPTGKYFDLVTSTAGNGASNCKIFGLYP